LLHDVGKIAVPDDILRHPGKLGREEWEIMQQHPVFGALIVKDVPHLDEVLGGIRHHHEKWDGTGYPDKLCANDIPLLGRLLACADVYSALTTDRPYRKGWTPEAALEEIERGSGTHFDPQILAAFLKVMRREISTLGAGSDTDYADRIAAHREELPADGLAESLRGSKGTRAVNESVERTG
jgi:HD-GYP domain-containing protein (c-di-GMP phosphodiesterase class II)